jgi:hypothetical protein
MRNKNQKDRFKILEGYVCPNAFVQQQRMGIEGNRLK